MNDDEKVLKCAACRVPIAARSANEDFPFCSERCRLLDLSNWLSESYRIPVSRQSTERSLPDEPN